MPKQPTSAAHSALLNLFPERGFSSSAVRRLMVAALVLFGLYLSSLYSFLLFHVLVEIFSIIVAFAIFMFAWNTRAILNNNALLVLGVAYLAIGALDLLHTLSYKGMGVFKVPGADMAAQLWIAARAVESLSRLVAPLFAGRRVHLGWTVALYALVFALLVAAIFIYPLFPTCYIEGTGLTPFKKISEYVISAILLGGLFTLAAKKDHFDENVFRLLAASLVLTIVSELMFTLYISVYGISNMVGHFFKLGSFWLIYTAILQTGLRQPFKLLFRELKQQENQLRKSEQRFRELVDKLPTGVCEIDPEMRFTYVNPAGMKITGYDLADIETGITFDQVLDADGRAKAEERHAEHRQGRTMETTEYSILRKDGSRVEVVVTSTPIFSEDKLKAIQTTLTDVTELKQLQKKLQEARKMEAIATLAGGMAHEVNNALMVVVGKVELMKLKFESDQVRKSDLEELIASCDRIGRLINQLLAYARGGRYRTKRFALEKFVTDTVAGLRKHIHAGIRVSCAIDPGLPEIVADPIQLEMVVTAVVSNAVEAIDREGSIQINLQFQEIDAAQARQHPGLLTGRYLLLSIKDSGKGMDLTTLQRIFEPFYSNKFPGRGLGMAATYGIVKNHGGWIGIDSSPGKGTTVRIYLPVASPPADNKVLC
jgi:PAS domain S-box-containing protein